MALKTFNLDEETYSKYSKHCKENGISMSKQVEKFIKQELEKINLSIKIPEQKQSSDSAKEHSMRRYVG